MLTEDDFDRILMNLKQASCDLTCRRVCQPRITQEEYDLYQTSLLYECECRKFTRNTKYLAKTYFDLAVAQLPHLNNDNAQVYLISALIIAVKFNENYTVSEIYTIEAIIDFSISPFRLSQFIEAEKELLCMLNYRLYLVTPYDFAHLFQSVLKKYEKERARVKGKKLLALIDFAISLPEFMLKSQEDIFFTCFLTSFSKTLNSEDDRMIQRHITNPTQIDAMKIILASAYDEINSSPL